MEKKVASLLGIYAFLNQILVAMDFDVLGDIADRIFICGPQDNSQWITNKRRIELYEIKTFEIRN